MRGHTEREHKTFHKISMWWTEQQHVIYYRKKTQNLKIKNKYDLIYHGYDKRLNINYIN